MTASLGTENSSRGPFSKPSWRSVRPGRMALAVGDGLVDGAVLVDGVGDTVPAGLGETLAVGDDDAVGVAPSGPGATPHDAVSAATNTVPTTHQRPAAAMTANLAGQVSAGRS